MGRAGGDVSYRDGLFGFGFWVGKGNGNSRFLRFAAEWQQKNRQLLRQGQKPIPFGDDNKKDKGDYKNEMPGSPPSPALRGRMTALLLRGMQGFVGRLEDGF